MDVSRIAHGVYLAVCPKTMKERLIGGKLATVYAALAAENVSHYNLYYLVNPSDGDTHWELVDLGAHKHYHGEQRKKLLHWFHVCGAQLSKDGFQFMANTLGINANRLRNALRPPHTEHFQPFSAEAMLYLSYRFDQWRSKQQVSVA